ncbi:transmembrane and coiled-coil domain protein 3-like isoform X2 [Oncorhynchus nerka]|uniref:transmembrane and coiled-coil domain protein 3-like isoform X2 n=1 Tax=Oncorhynchus nerka TaxID=8023 RepID=UPI0031B88021
MPSADTVVDKSLSEVERYNICGEMAERGSDGNNILSLPVPMRRGGSESNLVSDGGVGLDFTKGRLAIDSLQQKILKVTEQIKVEQTARDQNVAEYLKLVNNADKQQVARIRQVFEKKNQKSAHSIAQLQRKLEQYHRRMKEEANWAKHPPRDARGEWGKEGQKDGTLRDVSSASARNPAMDKVKTIGPGVSLSPPFFFNKSREFANLIRNKFGSADNIAHMKSSMETGAGLQAEGGARALSGSATTIAKAKYPSDDECSIGTSVSADSNGNPAGGSGLGSGGGPGRSDSQGRLGEVLEEVREIREAQAQLAEDMESLKRQFKSDYSFITQTLQEERYRRTNNILHADAPTTSSMQTHQQHPPCRRTNNILHADAPTTSSMQTHQQHPPCRRTNNILHADAPTTSSMQTHQQHSPCRRTNNILHADAPTTSSMQTHQQHPPCRRTNNILHADAPTTSSTIVLAVSLYDYPGLLHYFPP